GWWWWQGSPPAQQAGAGGNSGSSPAAGAGLTGGGATTSASVTPRSTSTIRRWMSPSGPLTGQPGSSEQMSVGSVVWLHSVSRNPSSIDARKSANVTALADSLSA